MNAIQQMPSTADELLRCKHWIESALEYAEGTHDFKNIVDEVLTGTMQLWAGEKGCAVTQIINYPNKKVLHVFLAGGEMEQIVDFQESAKKFGKMNGCTAMSIAGRKGWAKVLPKHGWSEKYTVMGMEI